MSSPFSRRQLLRGGAGLLGSATLGLPFLARAGSKPKNFILVFAYGGWDPTFTFDPKLDTPSIHGPDYWGNEESEFLAEHCSIPLCSNAEQRPAVSQFFQNYSEHCAVVNGIWVGSLGHHQATLRILSGSASSEAPDIASLVGSQLSKGYSITAADLGGWTRPGALGTGVLRQGFRSQMRYLLDRGAPLWAPEGVDLIYPLLAPGETEKARVRSWLDERSATRFAERATKGRNAEVASQFIDSRDRARDLTDASLDWSWMQTGAIASLEVQAESAVNLLKNGISQTVLLASHANWDTHRDNRLQNGSWQDFFVGLNVLADGLSQQGLLEDTVVLAFSEMCRTPQVGTNGFGKDNWHTSAALLFGGGVQGGRAMGGTDAYNYGVPVDLESGTPFEGGTRIRYDNFAAGVLELLDLDPAAHLPGVTPFRGFIG